MSDEARAQDLGTHWRQGEWRSAGGVVAAAAIGYGLCTTHVPSLGLMMGALHAAFGWSRAEVSAALPIVTTSVFLIGPAVGALVDRVGSRRVVLMGLPLYGLGLACLGLAGPSIWSWYALWAWLAICYAGVSPVVWNMAVASRFEKHRGMALALASSGSGIAGTIIPLLALFGLQHFGWRGAYLFLSGLILLIAWPLAWRFFYSAVDLQRVAPARATMVAPPSTGLTLAEAIRTSRFHRLALAMIIAAAAMSFLTIHMVPMMTDKGLSTERAVLALSLLGPAGIVGRVLAGLAIDRFRGSVVAAIAFAAPAISCALLLNFQGSTLELVAIAATAGLAAGAEVELIAYLVSRYFGLKAYGAIFGFLYGLFSVGYGLSPVLGGLVFDRLGTYAPILIAFSGGLVLAAVLAGTLGRYPIFAPARSDLGPR